MLHVVTHEVGHHFPLPHAFPRSVDTPAKYESGLELIVRNHLEAAYSASCRAAFQANRNLGAVA